MRKPPSMDDEERIDKILAKQYRWDESKRPTPDEWRLLLILMDQGILYCRHFIFYWEPNLASQNRRSS